jgi:predicted dienelactone hydrolase
MKRILALLAFVSSILAEEVKPYTPPVPSGTVSELKLDWHDSARDRPVPVKLYFPKDGAGPFPIIIFSHGLGGSRDNYSYLGKHWAGCGYVSVHVQHLGSDDGVWRDVSLAERAKALQKAAMNISNATNRPLDAQFAMDQMVKLNADITSPLKGRLDVQAFAIAGHSFGGFTTLALAGQTFMLPLGRTKCYDEPRLKAAIQMSAPAPTRRTDLDKVYGSITVPTMHMTGTEDFVEILPQTKPADRRIPFDHMSAAETCLVIFNGGDHMIFSGRERQGSESERSQDEVFHQLICAGTTAFWDAYLKGDIAANQWVMGSGYAQLLGQQAIYERKVPAR